MVIVATVAKTHIITDKEVQEVVNLRHQEYSNLPRAAREKREKEIYQEELDNLIDRELLLADLYGNSTASGVSIEEVVEEVNRLTDERLSKIRTELGLMGDEALRAGLAAEGATLPVFRRAMARTIMAQQYVGSLFKELGPQVEPAAVRAYYDQHPEEFHVEDRVRYLDVFVSFNRYATVDLAREHAQALRVAAAFGADFVALIKVEEKGPPGRQNWDGIGSTRADVPPTVAPTVWSLKPGETSALIETPFGFHLVKVVERTYAGTKPFDETVRAACEDEVRQQQLTDFKTELMKSLHLLMDVHVFDPPLDASQYAPKARKWRIWSKNNDIIDISAWLEPVVESARKVRIRL